MDKMRQFLERFTKIEDSYWLLLFSLFEKQVYFKKDFLLNIGETENFLSFIDEGIVRFFIPKEPNEVTFDFYFENEFVSAYDSFVRQMPSSYNVQALTDLTLYRISFENLQKLYQVAPKGNFFGRMAAENMFFLKAKREISLLKNTAEERYLNLFDEQPHLIKKIPLKYIASYIGVTPQALSRIRRRIFS